MVCQAVHVYRRDRKLQLLAMKIPLAHIHVRAAERPEGYVEDVLSKGRVDGDFLEIDDVAYAGLVEKYQGGVLFPEPTLRDVLVNASTALARFIKAGCPVLSQEDIHRRSAVCTGKHEARPCSEWSTDGLYAHCALCGCSKLKMWLATEKCPLGKWPC